MCALPTNTPRVLDPSLWVPTHALRPPGLVLQVDVAAECYLDAATLIRKASLLPGQDPAKAHTLGATADQYIARAHTLKPPNPTPIHKSTGAPPVHLPLYRSREAEGDRLDKLAEQAFLAGKFEDALRLFKQAAAQFISAAEASPANTTIQDKAAAALRTAQKLDTQLKTKATDGPPPAVSARRVPASAAAAAAATTSSGGLGSGMRGARNGYSAEEIDALLGTSKINGETYLPWLDDDRMEDFTNGMYTDASGHLKLAEDQKKHVKRWLRASQLADNCVMIKKVTSHTIKQTVVADCSFVCSLCVAADYERFFKSPLITNRIWPRKNGLPAFNPTGKYMVKLHFNGVWRKVVIDDYLPVSHGTSLLCTYTKYPGELWVSLIEKAYLKVMGGYDFPGSNSGVDMHALTGWIPERLPTSSVKDADWSRMMTSLQSGNLLITVATGPKSKAEEDRTGLADCHAYAVLDMREAEGKRMVHIKNPWNKNRWKGRYNPHDTDNWTPSLAQALQYNLTKAREADDGEFWVEWEIVCKFWECFHMNWNPAMLKYQDITHRRWEQHKGPVRDRYNMGENPQYTIEVNSKNKCQVWVLLSRHIVDIDDFANNREFITCHIFRGGSRIHYTDQPLILGTKINSPHYLARFEHPGGAGRYTVVISQHEKSTSLTFTLKVLSNAPFKFGPVPDPYKGKPELRYDGEWTEHTAGGCSNYPDTYMKNPKWRLVVGSRGGAAKFARVRIQLFGPKEYPVGLNILAPDEQGIDSGNYRPGYCLIETEALELGKTYTVMPSTYKPGQRSKFWIKVTATEPFKVTPVT
eukprot:m.24906 g.24906  ORF g.24906 m.24906 type:complete len:810 (-) comp4195_c0_seq2:47-2476(-)